MLLISSAPVLIRHLWQLKTVVFQHRCLNSAFPLDGLAFHPTLSVTARLHYGKNCAKLVGFKKQSKIFLHPKTRQLGAL